MFTVFDCFRFYNVYNEPRNAQYMNNIWLPYKCQRSRGGIQQTEGDYCRSRTKDRCSFVHIPGGSVHRSVVLTHIHIQTTSKTWCWNRVRRFKSRNWVWISYKIHLNLVCAHIYSPLTHERCGYRTWLFINSYRFRDANSLANRF